MQKPIIYALTVFLATSQALSQMPQVTVNWGPEQKGSTGKDDKGNITRKALFSAAEAETLTCPRLSKQVDDNVLEIYGKKGKKYKWGTLVFH
jgi:hypothetical protein